MTDAKIKKALQYLDRGTFSFKDIKPKKGEYTLTVKELNAFIELRKLLEQELVYSEIAKTANLSSQKAFEIYIKKFKMQERNLFGTIEGKQIFSNGISLYVMNEPFIITPTIVNQKYMGKHGNNPPINTDNSDGDKEKLIKMLQTVRNLMESSIPKDLHQSDIQNIKDITYNLNEGSTDNPKYVKFNTEYISQMFKLLGKDLNFKLSLTHPILSGENEKGKAYLLALKPLR